MNYFLNGLFYQYFKWQVKVGNEDEAPFFSFLSIYLISFFITTSFLLWSLLVSDFNIFSTYFNQYAYYSILLLIASYYYFMFLYKKKYIEIMNKGHLYGNMRLRVIAIALPIISFIFMNLGWILKMFQNRGDL